MSVKYFISFRRYSCKIKADYFVTTPIYYVNANPHIGHLYSSLVADTLQRWHHLTQTTVKIKFTTGTDEHGSKIQQAAAHRNSSPSVYCNNVSEKYRTLVKKFNIGCTDFIRTTDEKHKNTVQEFWRTLQDKGHIHRAVYEGWYCIPDESFLSSSQLREVQVPGGERKLVSTESGHPVEWTSEENYLFKLSNFQDALRKWLERKDAVRPEKFRRLLLDLVNEESLPDVSVSRPASRVHWGISVPGDSSQTVYVWLDALVNYLTAVGYDGKNSPKVWPPDVQVIGKDILKFHGIYWPSFLMAADLEPPRTLLCHSHWTVDGEKMSKSKGNVICPFDRADMYTAEGLRYFLLREGVPHSDGNYSDQKARRILNSELADTLGNLLSRCTASALNPCQVFPNPDATVLESLVKLPVTSQLLDSLYAMPDECSFHYTNFNFHRVADTIMATLRHANQFVETLRPWELRRDPARTADLETVLHVALETLRRCGILLQPLIPFISAKLLDRLNCEEKERAWESLKRKIRERKVVRALGGNKQSLYERLREEGKTAASSTVR